MKYFVFLIILSSCNSFAQKEVEEDFKALINENKSNINKLIFDGYYNNETAFNFAVYNNPERDIYTTCPIFFFENGLLCTVYGTFFDSIVFRNELLNPIRLTKKQMGVNWGTYKVEGNEIKAIVYLIYSSHFSFEKEATYFIGTIQNSYTIVNWHPIPPFPTIRRGEMILNKETSTLKFTRYLDKASIDSSKAWVNQYRK